VERSLAFNDKKQIKLHLPFSTYVSDDVTLTSQSVSQSHNQKKIKKKKPNYICI